VYERKKVIRHYLVVNRGWMVSREVVKQIFSHRRRVLSLSKSFLIYLLVRVLFSGKAGIRGRDVGLWFRQLFLGCSGDVSVQLPLFRGRCGTGTAEIDRMAATTMSVVSPVSATVLICRQSLNNAIACQHTSIHGKVPTNHECPHGCVLLSQSIGFVREISLVLSPIDKH
jgi:hypothetical protein